MPTQTFENLANRGCVPVVDSQFEKVFRCGNSYVIKSPSTQFSVLVPAPKIAPLQKKVVSPKVPSLSIDAGQMVRTNGWSHMFSMLINNQVHYKFPETIISKMDDPVIKDSMESMEDLRKLFGEEVNEMDLRQQYQRHGNRVADRINTLLTRDLKDHNKGSPIGCTSHPIFHKYWTASEGEGMAFKVTSTCIVPDVQRTIENVIDPVLEQGKVSHYNVRYISSRLTKDRQFLLDGINLYQQDNHPPMLRFSIQDEAVIAKNDFVERIADLEKQFAAPSEEPPKPLELGVFTKYLQW